MECRVSIKNHGYQPASSRAAPVRGSRRKFVRSGAGLEIRCRGVNELWALLEENRSNEA
jgi:hypothetical protein